MVKKLVEGNVKIPDKCSFIVIGGITQNDINPIFLKKTFKVELDNEGDEDKKVADGILETIENNLKTNFGDKVVFSVQDIINNIKAVTTSGASPSAIFKNDAFNTLGNVTIAGVNTAANAVLKNDDKVNSAVITITIKEAAFAEGVVKIEFTINCDLPNNNEVGGKKVKQTVINAIKGIINSTTSKITKAAFVQKFNDSTAIKRSSDFAVTDFVFTEIESGSDIVKSGKITINDSFWSKLTDACFEAPAKPKGGEGSGSSNGGEQKGDNNKGGKGCSGSGKKNK